MSRVRASQSVCIALSLLLGCGLLLAREPAAEARPAAPLLTNSRLGYVPPRPVTKGPWIKRKVQNIRVRRAQRLQQNIERNLDSGKRRPGNLFGLIKRGKYHNMVLQGVTTGGQAVTVITGKHRGFPFVSKKGNWDNFQLRVGAKSYAINGADLQHLKIQFKGGAEAKKVLVSYNGPVTEHQTTAHKVQDFHRKRLPAPAAKGTRRASFQVELSAKALGMMPMGVAGVFGMEYFPNSVKSAAGGKLAIDGRELGLRKVTGELESGRMSNVSAKRALTAVYDYRGVAGPGGTGHVAFTGKGAGSGKPGKLRRLLDKAFNGVARVAGTRSFGHGPEGIRHNKTLQAQGGRVIDHDVIKFQNGVTLERRQVELKDASGQVHRGLQERFF